jgi:hypothetical protein
MWCSKGETSLCPLDDVTGFCTIKSRRLVHPIQDNYMHCYTTIPLTATLFPIVDMARQYARWKHGSFNAEQLGHFAGGKGVWQKTG